MEKIKKKNHLHLLLTTLPHSPPSFHSYSYDRRFIAERQIRKAQHQACLDFLAARSVDKQILIDMTAFVASSLQASDTSSEYENLSIYENMSDWESSFLALAEAPGRPRRGSYGRRGKSAEKTSSGRKSRRSSGAYEGSEEDTPGGRSDRRGSERHPSAMGYTPSPNLSTRFDSDTPMQRSTGREKGDREREKADRAERKKNRARAKTAPTLPAVKDDGNFLTGLFRGLF